MSKPRLEGYTVRNQGWDSNSAQEPPLHNCHPHLGKFRKRLGASDPCAQLHKRKAERKKQTKVKLSQPEEPQSEGAGAKPRDHT